MTQNRKKTTVKRDLLNKKISQLTLEDIAQLEKALGTSTRPFPMWGPQRVEQEDGSSDIEVGLSPIASDSHPMRVFSERSYEEVVALAYADMPVPSMLDLFLEALERRADPIMRQKDILEGRTPQNENFNRTQMLLGDPGHGKSFMGALMGRLRSSGSVEVYDCGGKNMNDLLFEMVLDFGTGDALPVAVDKRLAAGTLQSLSLSLLKGLDADIDAQITEMKEAGEQEDSEKLSALAAKRIVSLATDGSIVSIDWAALKTAGNDKVQAAYAALNKVSKIEGLDKAGGNALGMNSQYGALIRAFLENREIVLDEYNKSREGSDNALQTVIQFLIGEIRECTVDNPLKNKDNTSGPSTFTFKREDMGVGFFVTFTGNKTEDGITTRSLNRSVYDRLKPDTLPDPEIIDWQHRICQMMVGLPVSTLYMTFQDFADKDPDAFGDWLMWLRETKARIEGAPIPELQRTLLTNWRNVVQSSDKLARIYDRWAEMTDAEKITANGNADLLDEVDEEYSKKEAMSFRRIKQHLEEAIPMRPRMQPQDAPVVFEKGNWGTPPVLAERVEENPSLHFGTRLVEYIENMVYKKAGAVSKPKLYAKLIKAMNEIGLREATFKEGAHSNQRSVEQDLNISSFTDRDLSKQAKLAQKIFCDYLRQVDPEIQATDEQIVTGNKVLEALRLVSAQDSAETKELFVANRDHESVAAGQMLAGAEMRDAITYSLDGHEGLDFSLSDLVTHDSFMAALALPTVGAQNLKAIWDSNIKRMMEAQAKAEAAEGEDPAALAQLLSHDEALRMAENRSEAGIATTTLRVLDENTGYAVSVHVVTNTQRGKTLIVSEKVPSKLLAAFNEAGITHVDRASANAKARIDSALNDLTRGMQPATRERLADAFKYRNAPANENEDPVIAEQWAAAKLVDILTDDSAGMIYDKYLVRTAKRIPGS